MSHPRGFGFFRTTAVSFSVVAVVLLMLSASLPQVARADSKQFFANSHGEAFDAAAAAAAQSASPTLAKMRVEEPGLVLEDNSLPNRVSAVWDDSSAADLSSVFPAASNSSDETPRSYGLVAYDADSNPGASRDSSVSLWASNFYGGGGFYFYPGVPGIGESSGQSLAGEGSDRIDLGSGDYRGSDLNSAGGPGARRNELVPRIKWPLRILSDEPVPVPEPSSLLMLGCGVFALGLKRKYLPAK